MSKYRLSFKFTETEEQASALRDRLNSETTPYMRKHHPAHFTPWESSSQTDPAHFIVWFYC